MARGSVVMRVSSAGLDGVVGQEFKVLDKGFIRVVDYMGNDSSVVQAARVSYGEGTKTMREDKALINYLMRNDHSTPFEMCEIKFHIKLPIFVARQWIRHRTASVNEYSARYSIVCDEFYVPEVDDVCAQSATNRQCRGESLSEVTARDSRECIKDTSDDCYSRYLKLIENGVARELARAVLPVNFYTQWYWKIDLNNFMRFVRLRIDAHAQHEIRQYAAVMLDIMKLWVPLTCAAFMSHQMDVVKLSKDDISALRMFMTGRRDDVGVSKRRGEELCEMFELNTGENR